MKRRLATAGAFACIVAVFTAVTIAPAASAAVPSAGISGTVSGTCQILDATTGTLVNGTFSGLFSVTGFRSQGSTLLATGTLSGTCTAVNSLGQTLTQTITQTVTAAVSTSSSSGSCSILHLSVGPIHLNLLGLTVDTNTIVLDITAQSGPGNLLGNLLCAVVNALNSGATASQLANLLNQILAIL